MRLPRGTPISFPLYLRARGTTLRHPLKAVLKELCFIADDAGGSIYPSILTLARYSGLCERGVRNSLDELHRLGYISRPDREHRCGGRRASTVQYIINVDTLPTGAQDAPHPCTGCTPTPAPHSMTPAPGAPNRPYRQEKDKYKTSPRAPRSAEKFNLPDWISAQTWNDYEEMRRRIRKPMTDSARGLAVRKLGKLKDEGHIVEAVLEQSVFNSWQGLFPLKVNSNGNGTGNKRADQLRQTFDRVFKEAD